MNGGESGARIDNRTWLIDVGHDIIEKKRANGIDVLTPRERLIHCVWMADYSMRNSGDLASARELAPLYRADGARAAAALGLPLASALFGVSEGQLERQFFDLFDDVCGELRAR